MAGVRNSSIRPPALSLQQRANAGGPWVASPESEPREYATRQTVNAFLLSAALKKSRSTGLAP